MHPTMPTSSSCCRRSRHGGTASAPTPSSVIDNQQSLTSLAKGLEGINGGNSALLDLAQQAAQQIGQGGGTLREIEYANQLSVLSQRIAKNANALASSDEIDPEVAFLLGKDASTFREIVNGLLKGSDALRLAPVRSEDARTTLTELSKRFTAYDAGVGAILQNMVRLVSAKQAARAVNNESEALLGETTRLAAEFEGSGTHAYDALGGDRVRGAGARRDAAARQGVPRRRPRSRLRQRAREQAQPGGDPAPAERDGKPRRRRPHGAGFGDRGRDRRDRRLDQLHDRGAAHAGEGHQLGDRRGDEGHAGCAGDLEPAVRGVAAAEPGDPAGVGFGAADGPVDRRSVAVGGAVGERGAGGRWRPPKRARNRCRTRSPG